MKSEKTTRRRRLRRSVVSFLSCLAVFCTTYCLILPALTVEAESYCGYTEHVHTDECYEEQTICELEEHVHDENCYDSKGNLTCKKEEHIHDESCTQTVLICGNVEHTHTLSCYSNPEADIQSQQDWLDSLPEETEAEDFRDRVVETAESQLGQKESSDNYQVGNDNEIKGYTRYGAWNGTPYEDWSSLFVQFVLSNANVSDQMENWKETLKVDNDPEQWLIQIQEEELLQPVSQSRKGDILFAKEDKDDDDSPIKTGFITSWDLDDLTITAIMADWNGAVEEVTFRLEDERLQGILNADQTEEEQTPAKQEETTESDSETETVSEQTTAQAEPEEEAEVKELTQETLASDGTKVTVTYSSDILDENAKLQVTKLENNSADWLDLKEKVEESLSQTEQDIQIQNLNAYDISFADKESEEEVEPNGYVKVDIQLADSLEGSESKLYHLTDKGKLEDLSDKKSTQIVQDEDGNTEGVSFKSSSFSIYTTVTYETNAYSEAVSDATALINKLADENCIKITLKNDITVTSCLQVNHDVTIDLAGHRLLNAGSTSDKQLIVVNSGVLTVTSSSTVTPSPVTKSSTEDKPVFPSSSTSSSSYTVEYMNSDFIRGDEAEAIPGDNPTGETNKMQWPTYTALSCTRLSNIGILQSTGWNCISVANSAKLVLDNIAVKAADTKTCVVAKENSTVTMNNAYLLQSGRGIELKSGSSFYMTGGAIADNTGNISDNKTVIDSDANGCGIRATSPSEIVLTNAEICHNYLNFNGYYQNEQIVEPSCARGGGIWISGGNLTIMNSKINNNQIEGEHTAGGGIAIIDSAKVIIDGNSHVDHNQSSYQGGGIYLGEKSRGDKAYDSSPKLFMKSGSISDNIAYTSEGGGIHMAFESYCRVVLYGGTIANNQTRTNNDWGGGGIFCAEESYLIFPNGADIYNNTSNGYGRGLTACSTGQIVIGSSITLVDNKADGNRTAGKSEKHLDLTLKNKYSDLPQYAKDVFTVNITQMKAYFGDDEDDKPDGTRVGGNWTGIVDGTLITNRSEGPIAGNQIVAITSDVEDQSRVLTHDLDIYDNLSNIHGAGVLVNGILISGSKYEISLGDTLQLNLTKGLQTKEGNSVKIPSSNDFSFTMKDEYGNVIANATVDTSGNLVFDQMLYIDNVNGATWYLEENDSDDSSIIKDETIYKLVLTCERKEITSDPLPQLLYVPLESTTYVEYTYYKVQIKSIGLYKSEDGGTTFTQIDKNSTFFDPTNQTNGDALNTPAVFTLTSGNAFTNIKIYERSVKVTKNWDDSDDHSNQTVTVNLYQTVSGQDVDYDSTPYKTADLSDDNGWTYTFSRLPVEVDGQSVYYTVKEAAGSWSSLYVSSVKLDSTYYVAPTRKITAWAEYTGSITDGNTLFMIVSPDGTKALKATGNNGSAFTDEQFALKESTTSNQADITNIGWDYSVIVANNSDISNNLLYQYDTNFTYHSGESSGIALKSVGIDNCYVKTEQYLTSTSTDKSTTGIQFGSSFNIAHWSRASYVSGGVLYGDSLRQQTQNTSLGAQPVGYEGGQFVSGQAIGIEVSEENNNVAKILTLQEVPDPEVLSGYVDSYVITNTKKTDQDLDFSIQITKVDADHNTKVLQGAEFQLKDGNGNPLTFVLKDGVYTFAAKNAEESEVTTTLVTNSQGMIEVQNIKGGTYYLEETKAPSGYTPKTERDEIILSATQTLADKNFVYELSVTNEAKEYELPETGGPGIVLIETCGAVLITGSAAGLSIKKVKSTKRKKWKQ